MRAYAVAASLARVADEMVGVAVVLLVLARTGSPAAAGAVVTAYTLPSIVSGPVLGAWLDRTAYRRSVLAGGGVLLAATCVGLAATVGTGPLVVPVLLAAVTGLALPLTSGGYSSLVPRLVAAERLGWANALDAAAFNVGSITGPALAGTVAAVVSPAAAVLLIGVLALAGAVCTGFLPRVDTESREREPLLRTVRAGLVHLVRTPPLRGATLTTVLGYGSVGILATAMPLRAEELGHGRPAAGYLWTALEVGCLVAVALLGRLAAIPRPERTVFASTAVFGLVMFTWPVVDGFAWTLVVVAVAGLAEGLALPAIMSTRQRYTPPDLLAQVSTTGASLKIAGYSLGALAGGWLVPAAGPGAAMAVTAGTQLLAAGLGTTLSAARRKLVD
ncbi:MFS transporter [Actinokineospora auranticolor]|uniref:Putative MFS family arabinose efflux permease n=1 Tax=Actinokineospora auranticolor TaxID=155976 RepID=A0A2S6GNT8_9PSEU|nr:MFS transporter [Actinokineospora auranticolor]PPK66905.1 putative MFS family arabinose efflux permease [Actinokineospora auranticolor]